MGVQHSSVEEINCMSNTTLLLSVAAAAAVVEGHPFSSTLSFSAGGHPSLSWGGGGGGTVDEEEGDDGGLLPASSFGAAGGGVVDDLVDRTDDLLGYIAINYCCYASGCYVFSIVISMYVS